MYKPRRSPTSYSSLELNKMSTERLMDLHVVLYGAYPNTFDRAEIRMAVLAKQDEEAVFPNGRPARVVETPFEVLKRMHTAMFAQAPQFSDHDIRSMRAMYKGGYGFRAIATLYDKKPAYIKRIIQRKLYKDV